MALQTYPLEQVLEIKRRRADEAEKVVKEKQRALEKEQGILTQKEAERDKAKHHYEDKLKQIRKAMDEGTTSTEIIQMKAYLKVTVERVAVEEKKVKDQMQQVKAAEKNLETAQLDLKAKKQQVDKFLAHRTDWIKEQQKEQEIIEAREQDELGAISYLTHHPRKKK